MAYVETTSTGWFGRIAGSIKGILFGIVLIPVAILVLVFNERNAVQDIQANKEIGRVVVSVENDPVDPANEGKPVHLNGPAKTAEILRNETFGIAEPAIRLSWESRIYQWEEETDRKTRKKLGGGEETVTTYTYKQVWSDSPIDSSTFKEAGHENRGSQAFPSGSTQAREVTLGAFDLPPGLVSQIRSSQPLPLAELPAPLAEKGHLANGVFHTGDPAAPKIGDEKVSFSVTRPGDVSVLAEQAGNSFKPYLTASGKKKFLLYEGLLSADEVVKAEEQKAMFLRWLLRVVGLVVMTLGFGLLMRPLSVLADVVPIFGSLVGWATGTIALLLSCAISLVVVALSWLAFRPLVGIPLLVAAGVFFVLVIRKLLKGRNTPPPMPA